MNLLKQIINEMLLLEDVSINDINSAIDKHERIIIDYRSVEDEDAGPRVVEVYAYGLTQKGNPVIRGFQPYGNTMTKVPAWKFFLINGIYNWKPTGQIFTEPAKLFNSNGDKSMSVVYKIASFDKDEIYKTDTEKHIARLQNQINNPINIADLQKPKKVSNNLNNLTQNTKSSDIYKTDTERNMERLRQQLQNPTKIDLDSISMR